MPSRHPLPRPLLLLVALLLTVVVAAVVVSGRDDPYRVTVEFADAGQLVKGNLVKVGGSTVGTVSSIELNARGQAAVELQLKGDRVRPLHRGTRAVLRNTSLSSIANRIVVLEPGPDRSCRHARRG
jgi:phospholipid/cholesterol/gamma-HCH transport system substrate-binding protein